MGCLCSRTGEDDVEKLAVDAAAGEVLNLQEILSRALVGPLQELLPAAIAERERDAQHMHEKVFLPLGGGDSGGIMPRACQECCA